MPNRPNRTCCLRKTIHLKLKKDICTARLVDKSICKFTGRSPYGPYPSRPGGYKFSPNKISIHRVPRTFRCQKNRKKGIFNQKKRRKKGILGPKKEEKMGNLTKRYSFLSINHNKNEVKIAIPTCDPRRNRKQIKL